MLIPPTGTKNVKLCSLNWLNTKLFLKYIVKKPMSLRLSLYNRIKHITAYSDLDKGSWTTMDCNLKLLRDILRVDINCQSSSL